VKLQLNKMPSCKTLVQPANSLQSVPRRRRGGRKLKSSRVSLDVSETALVESHASERYRTTLASRIATCREDAAFPCLSLAEATPILSQLLQFLVELHAAGRVHGKLHPREIALIGRERTQLAVVTNGESIHDISDDATLCQFPTLRDLLIAPQFSFDATPKDSNCGAFPDETKSVNLLLCGAVTPEDDVFAVGCIAAAMFTGDRPFTRGSAQSQLASIGFHYGPSPKTVHTPLFARGTPPTSPSRAHGARPVLEAYQGNALSGVGGSEPMLDTLSAFLDGLLAAVPTERFTATEALESEFFKLGRKRS
jgi:serine/threonine protein kinase